MRSLVHRLPLLLICAWFAIGPIAAGAVQARTLPPYGTQALVRLSSNRPAVKVVVNGQGPFLFLVDSATSHTVFTPALSERLGIAPVSGAPVDVITAAGSARSHFYLVAETATAGVIVEGVRAVVLPLPDELGVMGALGADFLSNFVVDMNFFAQTITLYPEFADVHPPGFRRIKGTVNSHGFIVVPSIVERIPTSAVFDSGAAFTVGNHQLALSANRYGVPMVRVVESTITDAIRQRQFAAAYTFAKIGVGPAAWWNARVLIADMRVFGQVGLERKPAIFIGMDLMSGRRIILDYGSASLWLQP